VSQLLCLRCGNPSRDGGLCDADTSVLRDNLRHAAGLLDDLDISTTMQSVLFSQSRKVRSAEPPMPVNLKSSDLAAGYDSLLVSWARACGADEDRDLFGTGRQAAAWMLKRINSVRMHEAAGDLVDELVSQAGACWRAIDRPAELTPFGACGAAIDDEGNTCPRQLFAEKGATAITCRSCGTWHELKARYEKTLENSAHMQGQPSEVAAALSALGVHCTSSMIRGMAHRRRLDPTHVDEVTGRTWYRLGDVSEALKRQREEILRQEEEARRLAS
jgi:hypothetical protein